MSRQDDRLTQAEEAFLKLESKKSAFQTEAIELFRNKFRDYFISANEIQVFCIALDRATEKATRVVQSDLRMVAETARRGFEEAP